MSEDTTMHIVDDEKPYIEYLAGRAVPKASPKRRHALVQTAFVILLRHLAGARGAVGTEWRFHPQATPPRTSLVPDVAFVSHERMAGLTEEQREEPPFAPDIAVEVRSPSDRTADVEWKMRSYLSHGAIVAFDVLPQERLIRAFTSSGISVYREGEQFMLGALPWLAFNVADVFADLD